MAQALRLPDTKARADFAAPDGMDSARPEARADLTSLVSAPGGAGAGFGLGYRWRDAVGSGLGRGERAPAWPAGQRSANVAENWPLCALQDGGYQMPLAAAFCASTAVALLAASRPQARPAHLQLR